MPRLLCRFWQEERWRLGRPSDRSAKLIAALKGFLDEVARFGFGRSELGKMFGDA